MKLIITYTHGSYDTYAYVVKPMEYESVDSLKQEIEDRLPIAREISAARSFLKPRPDLDDQGAVIKYRKASFDVADLFYECDNTDYEVYTLQDWFNKFKS